LIESEELLFDGNVGVRFGGDRREQVKSAAEFLVEHGAGQAVAARGASVQKEPAANDMRLHPPPPRTSGLGTSSRPERALSKQRIVVSTKPFPGGACPSSRS